MLNGLVGFVVLGAAIQVVSCIVGRQVTAGPDLRMLMHHTCHHYGTAQGAAWSWLRVPILL